jgi:hypothetical protein
MTSVTPSHPSCRICLAAKSSYGSPRRMNSKSSPLGGSVKTATRVAMPLCTRSAACSAPAPPESGDIAMMSAGATGSSMTSTRPAARKIGSQTETTATTAAAANATTINIKPHLGRRELMLWLIPRFRMRDARISVFWSPQTARSGTCGATEQEMAGASWEIRPPNQELFKKRFLRLKRLFQTAKEPAPQRAAALDRRSALGIACNRAAVSSPASPATCGSRTGAA